MYDKPSREHKIHLAGEIVGRQVTFAKRGEWVGTATDQRKTVYSGRLSLGVISLSVEATSPGAMLNKLASELSRRMKQKPAKPSPESIVICNYAGNEPKR